MRKLLNITIIAFFLLLGCEEIPVLEITAGRIDFSHSGGTETVSVQANGSWTVNSTVDWLHYTTSQNGFTLVADPNTTSSDRSVSLRVQMGELSKTITVYQEGVTLMIPLPQHKVGYEGGTLRLGVKSNVPWQISSDSDWIQIQRSRAVTEEQVSVSVAPNPTHKTRSATITVSGEGLSHTSTVDQDEAPRVLVIHHDTDLFSIPTFEGIGVYGLIDWGDGSIQNYLAGRRHRYNQGDMRTVSLTSLGSTGFELGNLHGIKHIDLSGYRDIPKPE